MKHFFIAGMFVLALTACRKERTCVCTPAQANAVEAGTDAAETTTYKKITRIKAKKLCRKMGETYQASTYYNNGGTTITNYTNAYDCELK
jgi:hypothetical protein